MGPGPTVYIVWLSVPVDEFRSRLRAVDGAVLVRELPPGRAVVALPGGAAAASLAALEGVEAVALDRLEHPDPGGA